MPDQENYGSQVGGRVPTNWKTALESIAHERRTAHQHIKKSDVLRNALELYLAVEKAAGSVPEDARDDVEHIDVDEVLTEHGVAVAVEGRSARGVEI